MSRQFSRYGPGQFQAIQPKTASPMPNSAHAQTAKQDPSLELISLLLAGIFHPKKHKRDAMPCQWIPTYFRRINLNPEWHGDGHGGRSWAVASFIS